MSLAFVVETLTLGLALPFAVALASTGLVVAMLLNTSATTPAASAVG
jgi:hypothetical protein